MIADKMRKGGITNQNNGNEIKKLLSAVNLPEWYFDSLEKMQYLFPKAQGISYVKQALAMMGYKINYPELYAGVS